MGYAGLAGRYYIDISTEQAERLSQMAFVAAQKAQNVLWLYITGVMLSGILSLTPPNIDVFMKQDKDVKREKQIEINKAIKGGMEKMFTLEL